MSKYRKALVAIVGAALEIIPAVFPHAAWAAPAAPTIAGLTALVVYLTPNKGKPA